MLKAVDRGTQWRGQPDTQSRHRLWGLLAFSVLLHAPLTPLAALFGLIGLLAAPDAPAELPPSDPITAIPVDLLSEGPEPGSTTDQAERATEPSEPSAEPEAFVGEDAFDELEDLANDEPEDDPADEPEATDAGADESADAGAEISDAGAEPADAEPADAGDAGTGQSPNIGDPVAMSGTAGAVADSNANVRLMIYPERIRSHPLGERIGTLLGRVEQWKDFFGPTALDPIHDFDRILIAGPQLRDSSQVIAVLRYNVSDDKMRHAVEALVSRSKGEWLDAGVPAARAKADRADRTFVLPAPNILVVTPPSAEANVIKQGPKLKFPPPQGGEAMTVYVVTPWRVFIGLPFKAPQSIQWVRMKVTPTSDGGAVAELIAQDASEEEAEKNAAYLESSLQAVTQVNLGVLGALFGKKQHRFIEKVEFHAKGDQIIGRAQATPKQLVMLAEAIGGLAEQQARKVKERRAKKKQQAAERAAAAKRAAAEKRAAAAKKRPKLSTPEAKEPPAEQGESSPDEPEPPKAPPEEAPPPAGSGETSGD